MKGWFLPRARTGAVKSWLSDRALDVSDRALDVRLVAEDAGKVATGVAGRARPALETARRRARSLALIVVLLLGALFALSANAAPVIPVPNPLVKVRTESGNVVRERVIPLGGVPVPIDVDERLVLGLLFPDVDVSVGLLAASELPGNPIVPTIRVDRDPVALLRNAPAPPLKIDFTIELNDAGNGFSDLADVTYGYETPPGGLVPPKFSSKLIGPIEGGFVDPLEALVETPGYAGPLKLNADVTTADFKGDFQVGLNPLPERIHFIEDPRDDGLDFAYDHRGAVPDVKLDAAFDLTDRVTDRVRHVDASVERLPQEIKLSNTNTDDRTFVEYEASGPVGKPDLEANYRDTQGNGNLVVDANVKVAGLPAHMEGEVGYAGEDLDSFDFRVLDGEEIESIDFLARNYLGDPGPVPEPALGPDQFVAVATRQMPDASTRFRAAGRILGVRSAEFERQGDDDETIDVTTDIGDGNRPLRAIADLDNRGPGGPADPDDRKRLKVDTTVTPLPRDLHVNFDPSRGDDPTQVTYDSGQSVDVDAEALIADGDTTDGCGQSEVTCLTTRVDKLPSHLEASLPGEGAKDFSVSHSGASGTSPDVRAIVDRTPVNPADRTYAEVELLRVPEEVTGRLDITEKDVLRAAEFHACKWDFDASPPGCTDAQGAIGSVRFTVRDKPSRTGLPPRPDTATQFIALLKRDELLEATGRVDEVRNVVFRQRDQNDDGEADGTLGTLVDVGSGGPFDAVIDDVSDFPDPDDTNDPPAILGKGSSRIDVNVTSLPSQFSACVREPNDDEAPPDPSSLPDDDLLDPCDKTDILKRGDGNTGNDPTNDALEVTPLSLLYKASSPTDVHARIAGENPDKDDPVDADDPSKGLHRETSLYEATVEDVPSEIRTDVISPQTPDTGPPAVEGRALELDYDASSDVPRIDFEMQARRTNSVCEDPRPNRQATCLTATLTDLPDDVFVSYDPDDSRGDIEFVTSPPESGDDKLSINKSPEIAEPMRLSVVNPDPTSQPLVLDARIEGITDHMTGKLISKDVDGEGGLGPGKCTNGLDDDSDAGESGGGIDAADDDCEKDLGRIALDACPDGGSCSGIDEIFFKATNVLIGDPLPQPNPATSTIGGVTQDFSFIQREEQFRAQGLITKLKHIGLSQLDENQDPSATTRIEAAFGSGLATEKVRAYVDTDSGAEQLLADAVIAQAPSGIDVCLRDAIPGGSEFTPEPSSSVYCDTAPNDQLAMQVALDQPATTNQPDIDLRQLRVASGGGTSLITGDAQVQNLGERIDILVGKQAQDGDIFVEGQQISDDNSVPVNSAPDNVADRVSFNLRNREVAPSGAFPWTSLENSDADPSNNTVDVEDAAAGNDGNYLKFFTDAQGRFIARGSVPDIKRIAKRDGVCEPGDARFPDPGDYPPTKVPSYSCLNAIAAGGQKLGLAVRTLDAADEVLELEEGHVTAVPSGGLLVTLAKSPDAAGLDPVCADPQTDFPCRPPMLSLEAPRGGAAVPRLRARLSSGNKDLIEDKLLPQVPDDVISQNLNYEQAPKDFAEAGARVKVGTDESPSGEELLGIRMNANLPLHQFLDLDPPTLWSCKHDDAHEDPNPETDCSAPAAKASSDFNEGFESKDIFFKLVAADDDHDGSDVAFLGRVAVLVHDYKAGGTQTVLSGAPGQAANPALPDNHSWFRNRPGTDFAKNQTADPVTGADSRFPENFAPSGDPSHRGFRVPGHLDVKVYLRNDYEAPGDDDKQQNYAQVDGRVNSPLTMAVRLNDGTVTNRAGQAVPPTQLTLRNAPGTNGADNYGDPSFRVRAELKKGHVDQTPPNLAEQIFTCDGAGYGIQIPALLTLCLLVPTQAEAQWLDVALNMDPNSNGTTTTSNPARTVDAVAGPFGGSNDADLRGFEQVNGSGGDVDVNKGDGAA
ncbi:MAG: hypothetical protein ACRDKX_03400, partial [Solirubrobacterales bacterium]